MRHRPHPSVPQKERIKMKRIITLTAAVLIIFAGCTQSENAKESTSLSETTETVPSTAVTQSTEGSTEHTETNCTKQTSLTAPTSLPASSTAESRTEPKLTYSQTSAVTTGTTTQVQTTLPTTTVPPAQKTTQAQMTTQTSSHALNAVTPPEAKPTETVTADKKITVTVFCSCKNAVDYGIRNKEAYGSLIPEDGILIDTAVKVSPGSTAMDAIKAACRQSGIEINESRGYIKGIGGLYEKDCGGASGWLYSVNGSFPYTSSDKYVLEANDTIELHYTVKNGDVTRM